MPKIESTKQAPPDPAQLIQTAPTPSGSGAATSASADSAAPSAQLGGLAIRPRRLARASRANPPAASSSNAKEVMAALFAAPSVPQGPDLFEVLSKASSRLKRFNDLAQTVAPTEPTDIKVLEARLRAGASAIESARQGLQALAELNLQKRMPLDNIQEHESYLVSNLAVAASLHYGACEKMIDQKLATEFSHVNTQRVEMVVLSPEALRLQQPEPWLALRAQLLNALAAMEEVCQRIKSPMTGQGPHKALKVNLLVVRAVMGSCHERMQTVRGALVEIHSRKLADEASDCGLLQVLDGLRQLQEIDNLHHAEVGEALSHLVQVHIERMSSTEHSLTPERLALCKNLLVEYAELRGRAATQLCTDAAALIEEEGHARDHLWPTMLDLAQALTDQRQAIVDLCQFAVQDRQLTGTPASSPEQVPASITPSVPTTAAGKSSRSRKGRTHTPGASSSAAVPAQRVVDERSAAQKQADEVLRSAPLESLPVAELGGDFIALAKRLGKDTTDVERLIGDSRHDAATAFDFARTRMQGWFGSSERLLQFKSKLRAGDERIEQLDTRLRLFQRIEHDFERRQADALKTDPQPRAPHLERLLAMNGLARITAPNLLRSEGDRGDRGRLFEVRIEHTPQSNGDNPAPWFVHIHTDKPVTPAGLRALHYKDLTAVHLKTAREVNLGARWEEMMRALGNTEAKVHRATIGSKLLGQLWAAGTGGQG
ncbi:outer protein P [Xanthomonas axonopodis]|uniref:Outer protein P n=1 Tax=Xanthomonas axonopodis TaxID=53413 RepID=A0A0P6VPR6_9XANT|nr:type III secretion system effector XopP [Xanthomonas axonopodis]KPL48023.1 outer protein P [Xanthomonas axonopodis]